MDQRIIDNKHYIILGGLIVGILALLGVLPETTTTFGLGYNVKYLWAGCMLGSGILYYMIYMEQNKAPKRQGQPQQNPASPQMYTQMPSMPAMTTPTPQSPQQEIKSQIQEQIRKQNLKENITQPQK